MSGRDIIVLVTGFSTWGPDAPINSSWLVAKELSQTIERPGLPTIRVICYPRPVRTSWTDVQKLIPTLWEGRKEDYPKGLLPEDQSDRFHIDFVVLIGMRRQSPKSSYVFEKLAHRDGYKRPDVDGKTPAHDEPWSDCPKELATDFDVDSLCEVVSRELPTVSVRTSSDAGLFLCDYIYYTSLAELHKRNERKRVIFLHVPPQNTDDAIERGVTVATKLILAMAESLPSRL